MTGLNKSIDGRDLSFFSQTGETPQQKEYQALLVKLSIKRQEVLQLINELSLEDKVNAQAVHSLNFSVTEYIFWSHFILCENLQCECTDLKLALQEQSTAMSYLTSAIQFVPESREAISHFISLFTDRFALEDHLLGSFAINDDSQFDKVLGTC